MKTKISIGWIVLLILLAGLISPAARVGAAQSQVNGVQASAATPGDLIAAMNFLRVANGLPALVEDPIIDSVAQATAEYMAANEMSTHIGNVRGRIQAAGYGGGATVWATENIVMGFTSIDEIMQVWSDPLHMLPATIPAYCNIGAGHAVAPNGWDYYVLQAAYTEAKSCGEYKSVVGTNPAPNSTANPGVSQVIIPVKVATPDADGKVWHVVQAGQSLWSIAISYKVTIKDIEFYNNLPAGAKLQIGQKLFIPSNSTAGYATPTQVGLVQTSTPDAEGKVIHVVQAYQTLTTIAQAYGVKVDTILALNGIKVDGMLQIGQKLLIHPSNVTPSPTPRPLTPIEKLTPASDGKYYHIVKSGETLSWIAALYQVKLADLLAWNNLYMNSLITPGEKLLLEVTPPATATATPAPATVTPTLTPTATLTSSPTATLAPSQTATPAPTETATPVPSAPLSTSNMLGIGLIAVAAVGLVWVALAGRKKG